MNQDKEFQQRFNDYKLKSESVKHYSGFVKELLESPLPDSWKILDYLLITAQTKDRFHFSQLRTQIERSIKIIRSFTMLMYVYSLKIDNKISYYSTYWKGEYQQVAISLGEMSIFSSLIANKSSSSIVQESLWLVARTFPIFVKNQNIQFGEFQLSCVIEWVAYFETPDVDKYADVCELIKTAKQTRFKVMDLHIKKQHILLKKIIQVSCQVKNPASNIFLFIYPMPFMENQITYFCEIYSQFLTDIAQDGLLSFFITLTKSSLSKEILLMIQKISNVLAHQQEYYKLRFLYQNFILPVLVRRGKACLKVQQIVFDTCSLYILGFLKHCDIGIEGIECITKNIGKIKNEKVQQKWIQISALIASRYPQLKAEINELLRKQLNGTVELFQGYFMDIIDDPNYVWDITLRNGRKHKKYLKVQSEMKGISNRNNQCYIITVVHGLQKNRLFQNLLDGYRDAIKGKYKLLDELRILFSEVSGRRKVDHIGVSYLKKASPQEFIKSQHQEDAYEYLIKLIDLIENQMRNVPGMLEEFKSIFEIDQTSQILCTSCRQSIKSQDKYYIHTIPYTAVLSEETEQPLSDFSCPKCKAPPGSCVMLRKLTPKCKVLIVHINRFSHREGQTYKQLSTQRILRKFLNYELVGIICHRGKRVERGHYVYYHRLNEKRWAQFNDKVVEQFELEQPYEEFERQWKAQMTPYILIYQSF